MIEKFWRSADPKEDVTVLRHLDLEGCTLLSEVGDVILIGMKDGTILGLQGSRKLKSADVTPIRDMIKCWVPSSRPFINVNDPVPVADTIETDYSYFHAFAVGRQKLNLAFVPKVKKWFISTMEGTG